jgi:hypothetical protein
MTRSSIISLLLTTAALATAPGYASHPEPRVIVTVTAMRGGHNRDEVQRAARESWGGIVRCYKQLGKRERGTLTLRLEIAAQGKVVAARRVGSTLNDAVSSCLAGVLSDRAMPSGRSGSTATISVELAPGDN